MEELAHQLPGYIQYFSVGIFCAINYNFFHRYGKYLVIPGIILVIIYYTIGNEYFLPISLGFILMFIGFYFSILNTIGKTGDYSYGVYIFHFPIIQILISLGYFDINKNIALLVTLGTVFSISYLSWYFMEKKILKR
jgi:peptidoglycan/LPS O-acetylase OafA/YrhL